MLKSFNKENITEAGCDEAGRGCLAGPVAAAAVILPPSYVNSGLNDSKKLSPKERDRLRKEIEETAIAWAVAMISPAEIDRLNILNASILAMHKALELLKIKPELIIVDGNRFIKYKNKPHRCIVKGDSKYLSIAAASVLAKTHRDELMTGLHPDYPIYGWGRNKGYATIEHITAILKYGSSEYHRKSFKLKGQQFKLPI